MGGVRTSTILLKLTCSSAAAVPQNSPPAHKHVYVTFYLFPTANLRL